MAARRSRSALHIHVLVCICSNVRQFDDPKCTARRMHSVRPLNHLCCRILSTKTTGLQCYHRGGPVTVYYDLAQRLAPNRPQVSRRFR